ncbi:hypothetical protein EJ02DRAFT_393229 [Clathrospora elynae]|uniref:Uncharacterized protein n=1 Tax=Clathrospora elynae TaxID=706981 RepID=A0A6A5T2M5_9PLEO|nr:hypothetical protein EJ02DRAFT_393229 [Clathrospora elynae]
MSSPESDNDADRIRQSLMTLSAAVREMTPIGAKPIPATPDRFNFLARPSSSSCCRICALPGHQSPNITKAAFCRLALLSLVGFWEDIAAHVSFLYEHSERFQKAVQKNEPTYEMRLHDSGPPLKGGGIEEVLTERLTRNWVKFLAHVARIRAKVNVVLGEAEVTGLERVVKGLSGFLLDGLTLTDLYERSVAKEV